MLNTEKQRLIARESTKQSKRALPLIVAGALCIGVAFVVATLFLASCSASVSSVIKADGGARISVHAEIPTALAAKFRKLSAIGSSSSDVSSSAAATPLFDAAALRKAIAARPGLAIVDLSQPSMDSINVELTARSLEELAASPELKGSGIVAITRGSGWTECRVTLERGGAKAISALLPGMDPRLMEALSPPFLEEDPVSLAESKTMLKSVLGEKVMPSLEAAAISFSLTAPGPVLSSGGGALSGNTLTATIPVIEVLALEKPIAIWLRWKTPIQ
jgi:hypothetical protein